MHLRAVGQLGETIALWYLTKVGYWHLHSNWYFRGGELDLICYYPPLGTLVFVEVKYSRNSSFLPNLNLSKKKLSNLIRGMHYYISKNQIPYRFHKCRLDAICITNRNLKHYKGISLNDF